MRRVSSRNTQRRYLQVKRIKRQIAARRRKQNIVMAACN